MQSYHAASDDLASLVFIEGDPMTLLEMALALTTHERDLILAHVPAEERHAEIQAEARRLAEAMLKDDSDAHHE